MLSFYLKESLDITKIKDPEHSKESEVDFSGNLGRGVLLLSILFVIVYAILLVKFRRYIGAFEASLTPMIIGLISSILTSFSTAVQSMEIWLPSSKTNSTQAVSMLN